MLKFMFITNEPEVALIAEKYGVDRIWIDLETLGKESRQKNIDCVKSHHKISDIETISKLLTTAEMLVRVNPWNPLSVEEINKVIEAGADIVMLPMWKTVKEVQSFIKAVAGRAKTLLLLETREAEECLNEVLNIDGIDEIHIGLNDLHLSYGLSFMFELLSNGTVERICNKIETKGIPFGFGGIARIGEGLIPAEKIVIEHYRLNSSIAILSRSFCNTAEITDLKKIEHIFKSELEKIRIVEKFIEVSNKSIYEENRKIIKEYITDILHERQACKYA